MFAIKKLNIKLYGKDGSLKSNGWSNLVIIAKNKVKNAKTDIEASMLYGMYFRVKPYKDGYKVVKNPIVFNKN